MKMQEKQEKENEEKVREICFNIFAVAFLL